jgi:hypothetical protein
MEDVQPRSQVPRRRMPDLLEGKREAKDVAEKQRGQETTDS